MSLRVLTSTDVSNITSKLSPEFLLLLMEDVFALISSPDNNTEDSSSLESYTPHRTIVPTENHTALFMPARISGTGTTMKVVAVPSHSNDTRGLPASTLVLDRDTGSVKAIVNARSLTALRNAAGSLLSTTLVGPELPVHIVAFGAGQQILTHLDLFFRTFSSVRSCTIVNRSFNERVSSVVSELRAKHPSVKLNVLVYDVHDDTDTKSREVLRMALSEASIIIAATPSRVSLFPSSWVRTGTHIILIGSYTPQMKEVDTDLIMRAIPVPNRTDEACSPVLLVDSISACFSEAGELLEAGLRPHQTVEIGKLVLEKRQNIKSIWQERLPEVNNFEGPVTIFKSVGIGLQDVAIACAIIDKAEKENIGILVQNFD